jgi:uncharacterized protein with PQ loop repeat
MLVLQVLTGVTAVLMVLSPSVAITKMMQLKTTGNASVFPLMSLLANSFVWTLYGLLRDNVFPVAFAFGFGVIASVFYLSVYNRYCPSLRERRRNLVVIAVVIVLLAAITAYSVTSAAADNAKDASTIVGYIGIITAVLLYGAPMEKAVHVWRTKNAQPIQVVMVICGVLHNTLWVIYTCLDRNWFMFVPNIICLPLGLSMLALCVVYRSRRDSLPSVQVSDSRELPISVVISPTQAALEKQSSDSFCYFYDSVLTPLEPIHVTSSRGECVLEAVL